jgi:tetratricopeptide (TPR) repeat protein
MRGASSSAHGRTCWICYAVCLICALMIKPVQDGFEARREEPGPDADLLYFSSPALVKKLALGYDGLVADYYWMRTIQYYGRREEASKRIVRYKNLSRLLEITTTLDPDLLDAYHAGSCYLAEPDPVGAGQPREAIKLLERGISAHPLEWRLRYDKGFVYYWFFRDYRKAAEVWLDASRIPGAPHWMESLAAASFSKGGSIEMALLLWRRQYEESTRADVRENARNHLLSIQVDGELRILQRTIEEYRQKSGSFPATLRQLAAVQSGKVPIADPSGTPYDYDAATGKVSLSPNTRFHYLRFTIDD